jgi:hypothetical protein
MRVLALAVTALTATAAHAVTLPTGFRIDRMVDGPTGGGSVGFALLPDGRPLVLEQQTGVVLVAAVGSQTAVPVLTIPGVESVHPERGLLGVAVDPLWPARPYVYFDYTHVDSVTKITMYTASGDLEDPSSTNLAFASPYHLLDDIPDVNGIHNAGTLRFGPDGMLYVACGDDAQSCKAQEQTSPLGKILRLDVSLMPGPGGGPPSKLDITPPDNPFPGPDAWQKLVYAWGLRNPFRFTIDFPTGEVFIGNVGSHIYEEIDWIPGSGYTGNNYGWPQFEGDQPLGCCGTCGQGNVFTDAIHLIPHGLPIISVCGGPVMRTSASAISFPAAYEGDYFYFEVFGGTLHRLRETGGVWDFAPPAPGQPDSTTWGNGLFGACDAQLAPDGTLWLANFGYCCGFGRGIWRISADSTMTGALAVASAAEGTPALRVEPNPLTVDGGTVFRFEAPAAAEATIRIFDATGRLVRVLVDASPRAGARTVAWDGRTEAGRKVAAGVYLVRVGHLGERHRFALEAKAVVLR